MKLRPAEPWETTPSVAVISDNFGPVGSADDLVIDGFGNPLVPTAEQMRAYDLTILLAPIASSDRAAQLGGTFRLALDHGATIVIAYNVSFTSYEHQILQPLLVVQTATGRGMREIARVPSPHRAFRDYFTEYGRGDLCFVNLPEPAEILGWTVVADEPLETAPCAFAASVGNGLLYVLPFHVVSDTQSFTETLISSVFAHGEGTDESPPTFFSAIDLPGEAKLASDIETVAADLAEKQARIAELRQHKQLVGRLSGSALESLVITELNLVLQGSGVQARDTVELRAEDFEIVQGAERIAVAESKAESGGVSFANVNQLTNARSALDLSIDEMPGVLVINPFRNDETAERRKERIEDRLVRHACRQNVLIVRTWDLLELVARRLSGLDDSAEIREAIVGGGGWLEVTAEGITHHVSPSSTV